MIVTGIPMFLVASIGCLILVIAGIGSHRLSFESKAWMAVAWVLIIALLAFGISRFT